MEEMIQEYQEEHKSAKLLSTSVKCVEKESLKPVLNIPKTSGRMVRLSIQYSDNEDKSFLADDESNEGGIRGSRVVERKSVEKQKVSGEVKGLTATIEQLEVKLHRTELQLNSAESELSQVKSEN